MSRSTDRASSPDLDSPEGTSIGSQPGSEGGIDLSDLTPQDLILARALIIEQGYVCTTSEAQREAVKCLDLPDTVTHVHICTVIVDPKEEQPVALEYSPQARPEAPKGTEALFAPSEALLVRVAAPKPSIQVPDDYPPQDRVRIAQQLRGIQVPGELTRAAAETGYGLVVVPSGWRILDRAGDAIATCTGAEEAARLMHALAAAERVRQTKLLGMTGCEIQIVSAGRIAA